MRTTLDVDDAVLSAARAIARDEGVSIGAVISRLARRGLESGSPTASRSGFPVFEASLTAPPITLDLVNAHRDGE